MEAEAEARHLLRSAASVSQDCGEVWKPAMSRLMASLLCSFGLPVQLGASQNSS